MTTTMTTKTSSSVGQANPRPVKWGKILSYAVLIFFAIIYAGPLLMLVNIKMGVLIF